MNWHYFALYIALKKDYLEICSSSTGVDHGGAMSILNPIDVLVFVQVPHYRTHAGVTYQYSYIFGQVPSISMVIEM